MIFIITKNDNNIIHIIYSINFGININNIDNININNNNVNMS